MKKTHTHTNLNLSFSFSKARFNSFRILFGAMHLIFIRLSIFFSFSSASEHSRNSLTFYWFSQFIWKHRAFFHVSVGSAEIKRPNMLSLKHKQNKRAFPFSTSEHVRIFTQHDNIEMSDFQLNPNWLFFLSIFSASILSVSKTEHSINKSICRQDYWRDLNVEWDSFVVNMICWMIAYVRRFVFLCHFRRNLFNNSPATGLKQLYVTYFNKPLNRLKHFTKQC